MNFAKGSLVSCLQLRMAPLVGAANCRQVNYEDLFYFAAQARDEWQGETENPALYLCISKLYADMAPLFEAADCSKAPDDFGELLDETCNYVSDIVRNCLSSQPGTTKHLKIFAEACRSGSVTGIATLSHDIHVETYLREEEIRLADGFSVAEAGVRYWNGDLTSDRSIPFLKLHGSVDWVRLRPSGSEPWFDDRIGIPLNGDIDHTKTKGGVPNIILPSQQLLLIGTFNKVGQYARGIFRDLHYGFRSTLRESQQLVVCGYSFGDKGINSEIIDWYYGRCGRRFLVIHPKREDLVLNARFAIRNKWSEWEERESVNVIDKKLEDVNGKEFLHFLQGAQ